MKWVRCGAIFSVCMAVTPCSVVLTQQLQPMLPITISAGSADMVRTHIMAAWKVITISCSISPDYIMHFNQSLFDKLLLLHTVLWRAVHVVSSYEYGVIATLLGSFGTSCEEFCSLQNEQQVYFLRSMAHNAIAIWQERVVV